MMFMRVKDKFLNNLCEDDDNDDYTEEYEEDITDDFYDVGDTVLEIPYTYQYNSSDNNGEHRYKVDLNESSSKLSNDNDLNNENESDDIDKSDENDIENDYNIEDNDESLVEDTEDSLIEESHFYKKIVIIVILLFATLIISKVATTLFLNKDDLEKIASKYEVLVNDKNILDTELKELIPINYITSIDEIIERYAINKKLEEQDIIYTNVMPDALINSEQFQSLTYSEQQRSLDNFEYKSKKDLLLNRYLEAYRGDENTLIDVKFTIQVIETSSGRNSTLTFNSSNLSESLFSQLDTLSIGESLYNTELGDTKYTSITLLEKNISYTYSDESILAAKKNMDLELNNIIATFIVSYKD